MKRIAIKKYLVVLLILLVPLSSAFAGGWQAASKIAEYLIEGGEEGNRIYVRFDSAFNPDNCPENVNLYRVYGDTQKGKYLLATIMAAKAANATVLPMIHGCDDWGRPVVGGIMVK